VVSLVGSMPLFVFFLFVDFKFVSSNLKCFPALLIVPFPQMETSTASFGDLYFMAFGPTCLQRRS